MLRRVLLLALTTLVTACAGIAPPPWSAGRVEQASTAELAAWLLPKRKHLVVDHDLDAIGLSDGRQGKVVNLFEAPQPFGPGLCREVVHRVWALPLAGRTDPMLAPLETENRYGFLYRPASGGRCLDLPPGAHGFPAESLEVAVEGLALYTSAHRDNAANEPSPTVGCDGPYGPGRPPWTEKDCRALFQRLSPLYIRRVEECPASADCFTYALPDGWSVWIRGRKRVRSVSLSNPPPMLD